jgi:hypothetical protein
MDDSERLAEDFLKRWGFKDVVFEPDGNVSPDFLCDGRVAVEVRRLNKSHDEGRGGRPTGLEEVSVPLLKSFRKYLPSLGPAQATKPCVFVSYSFSRPVPRWKVLEREIDAILRPLIETPPKRVRTYRLDAGNEFSITVVPAGGRHEHFFVLGGYSDNQSGGWLLQEVDTHLKLYIAEKTEKISARRAKYPEWWLLMPDHIAYGLDEFEQSLFGNTSDLDPGGFDRVILLDPRDASRSFQVHPAVVAAPVDAGE